jgi:hypothetical protein
MAVSWRRGLVPSVRPAVAFAGSGKGGRRQFTVIFVFGCEVGVPPFPCPGVGEQHQKLHKPFLRRHGAGVELLLGQRIGDLTELEGQDGKIGSGESRAGASTQSLGGGGVPAGLFRVAIAGLAAAAALLGFVAHPGRISRTLRGAGFIS